jgi:hypothetical protein
MNKLYTPKTNNIKELKPKQEVVSFLINYSKSLSFITIKNKKIEIVSN